MENDITFLGSQINKYLVKGLGCVGEYNANNTWNFNGNNRNLNNNNRNNSNFRCRPCSDYKSYSKESANQTPVPLELIQEIEEDCKSNKPNCVRFRVNKIHNIVEVWRKINDNDVEITEAFKFTATVPKLREIIYCNYNDKLIQSFYVFSLRKSLENIYFDKDTYSCRKDMGVLKAVNQFREYIRIASDNYTRNDIYLASIDIKGFFTSIDTKLLVEKLNQFILDNLSDHPYRDKLLYLTECLYMIDWHNVKIYELPSADGQKVPEEKSLLNKPPYIGVPIGNWPSQIGGNFITTIALTFIRGLGYEYFVHYTDDTSFVTADKEKFLKDVVVIEKFYSEVLHLELHKKKRYLQHYSKGITVLGRRIKFNKCIPSERTFRSINKLVYENKKKRMTLEEIEHFAQSINSYFGMLIHMTTYNYRKKILKHIKEKYPKYYDIYETKQHVILFEPGKTEYETRAQTDMELSLLRTKNIKDLILEINKEIVENKWNIEINKGGILTIKIKPITESNKSSMTFNRTKHEYNKLIIKDNYKIRKQYINNNNIKKRKELCRNLVK
jgi:hypothetical protein